jgi:serine/threonine protein phosphatase PrpC
MTLALRYSIRSDVGLLREGNEDSAYAGPHLLVIADGMGGHAAGEVASAVAISALTPLDHEMAKEKMLGVLARAVAEANDTLHQMSVADPSVEGMGTTLTALLWSGSEIALCHIGDSRAYLLRDGDLMQITRDHTLVQSLVDEGRLSPEAAAVHPQRSLVMRALQSSTDAEPDLAMRQSRLGDRYLLCSDGLSDVISEETLHKTLMQVTDLDEVVNQLIELANRSGGPDNITCIVADVVDSASGPLRPSTNPVTVGAASHSDGRPRLRTDSPAGRAHLLTQATAVRESMTAQHQAPAQHQGTGQHQGTAEQPAAAQQPPAARQNATALHTRPDRTVDAGEPTAPGDDEEYAAAGGGRRRWPVVTSILVILLIVIVGGGYAAWQYTRGQYYVGADAGQVVIYRGVNQTLAGLHLSSVYRRTGIPLSGVPVTDVSQIKATIPASNLADAQGIVARIRHRYLTCKNARAAVARWIAGKPKPVAYKVRVHGHTVIKHRTPSYRREPTVPDYCPPQPGAAG